MKIPLFSILATGLLFTPAARAQQNTGGLDVSVRSGIDWAEKAKRDQDPDYARDPKRARTYFLARVMEEKNGENLVKTVNAVAIAKQLNQMLVAHGFSPVLPGQKPDIVITVKYGRGVLSNPYTDSDDDKQHTGLSDNTGMQVWPTHEHFVGLEHKRQLSALEKLIIQVRAWKYPPPKDPKKKEELLWMTTMYVDDPDHRDLNEISEKMLAIGAPYFDRHLGKEDEVVVKTTLPDGHVNVGTPEVVPEPKPK